ncbi:MAG: clostripain-related cysteine peptidase [Fimbriimonadaceae bacterium]
MKFRLILALLAALIILACGGGGGGGSTLSTLVYTTDWTNSGNAGGGVSQRVSVYDSQGRLLKSLIVNKGSSPVLVTRIEGIEAGSQLVVSELYSQTNLGGVKTGEFRTILNIVGEATLQARVGDPVDSVKVTPESSSVSVPRSVAFYALPRTADGSATFALSNQITWSLLGGVGSIAQNGRFLSNTAGSGTVRALHVPTSILGSATVQVNPPVITRGKWSIFVFLNAANDLYSFSTSNVNQMETAAGNPDVRYILQWKQSAARFPNSTFDGTRRYLVKPDTSGSIASELVQDMGSGIDMGKPQTMKDFLDWAKTYYPADHYGVIVWNHGNGWRRKPNKETRAVSYDDETGNAIQIWELNTGLSGHHFDFIAWDSSLMQMQEVAYEIRDKADYIVGSEESPPAEGYRYDTLFAKFRDNPTDTPRNLTKAFVDTTLAHGGYASRNITQSVIDTTKIAALATATNTLAQQLMANTGSLTTIIPNVRLSAQSYSQQASPPRYYRDLVDVCTKLEQQTSIPGLISACVGVRNAVSQAVIWEGHNTHSPGSRGVAIDFTPGNVFISSASDYQRMKFSNDTLWDDWLIAAP